MRQLHTAIAATTLLALALVGCSGDDDEPAAPAEARPTVLTDLADDPAAATAVSESLRGLRSGNAGTFTAHFVYADNIYDYHGSYRLVPAQQRVSVTADLPEGRVETEAVGSAGRFFVRLPPDGPVSSPCWVSGDPQQIAEVTGFESNADFNQYPGAIALAATAAGTAFVEGMSDEVLGSVDLATAVALISPRLPGLLGVVAGSDRVLARISIAGGTLIGISVEGPAILASLEAAGTEADPEELAQVFGAAVPIEVSLADSGAKVIIEPPSVRAVIDLAAPGARERVRACD